MPEQLQTGAERKPRNAGDKAIAGIAGILGDPSSLFMAGKRRRDRRKNPEAKYQGSIETGGPFEATPYSGPTLQASNQGPTGGMDLTSAGPTESYYAQRQGMINAPSASESLYGSPVTSSLYGPSSAQQMAGRAQGYLQGQTASQGVFGQSRGDLGGTGQGEQFWNRMQGRFNQPTNAQQAYQDLGDMPGFDAYYSRARERLAGGLNDQLAARGQYGSSAGLDQISQGLTDLNAAQANREADFAMQQAQQRLGAAQAADVQNQSLMGLGFQGANQAQGQQLARLGLMGQLGSQSDAANLARSQGLMGIAGAADQGRLANLGMLQGMAGQYDQSRLGRFQAGLGAAQAAGQERFGRIGQGYNIQMDALSRFLGVLGPSLAGQIGADRSLFETASAAEAGLANQAYGQSSADLAYQAQQLQNNINTGFQALNTGGQLASSVVGGM